MRTRLLPTTVLISAVVLSVQLVAAPAMAWRDKGGIGWEHHEEGDGYYRQPKGEGPGQGGPTGPPKPDADGFFWKTEVGVKDDRPDTFTWECAPSEATPPNTGDTRDGDCGAISYGCTGLWEPDDRPAFPHAKLRQHDRWHRGQTPVADGDWDYSSWECVPLTDDDWVSSEEISKAAVDYKVFQQLGEPDIRLAPGARGYVNLPVVVSADYLAGDLEGPGEVVSRDPLRVRVPIEVERPGDNLTGEITATAQFSWTFKGGTPGSDKGQGEPYTSSVDPLHDSSYYVKTTYHTKGTKQIQLNVQWTGEVQVDGLDPEPIPPIDIPGETAEIPIAELDPVLGR